MEQARIKEQLKTLIIESLNLQGMTPEMIADEAPLFGEGMGLDSVDALELAVAIEKKFSIKIEDEATAREAFASVAAISAFIEQRIGLS